jgi:hypothetical protein
MANIKFSQFTVGNAPSDIDFVVGYRGADNIQISPANLLSGYLPLTGGTMTGNIKYNNSVRAQFGTAGNAEIQYTGSNFVMSNFTGDMILTNYTNDKDIIFQSDDGSGGTTEYFRLDGSIASGGTVYTVFPDNSRATFGTGFDLQVYHDASNSYIKHINSGTGDLIIQQERDDGDIRFQSDDGAGGTTIYFMLDGSETRLSTKKNNRFDDNVRAEFGTSGDLDIYHDGTHSYIGNDTGNLYIQQLSNDNEQNILD